MSYLGRGEDAVRYAERGLRLSPYDRSLFYSYFFLGLACYGAGRYDEAVKWCRLSLSENPLYTANLRILAAAFAGVGEIDRAKEVAQAMLKLEPAFSLKTYARTRQPFGAPDVTAAFLDHLHQASFPD